jgi:prophage regulatory protein
MSRLVRLSQILGQKGVSEKQAAENRKRGKGPKRPRPEIPALVPVGKSCWWNGVASGRFPRPIKLGAGRGAFWKLDDIVALINKS